MQSTNRAQPLTWKPWFGTPSWQQMLKLIPMSVLVTMLMGQDHSLEKTFGYNTLTTDTQRMI